MMSNKWTFSLTILITVFVMVFAVSPVMAATLELKVKDVDAGRTAPDSATGDQADYSTADGIQAPAGSTVILTLTTDEIFGAVPVDAATAAAALTIVSSGNPAPAIDATVFERSADGKSFTLTLPAPAAADIVAATATVDYMPLTWAIHIVKDKLPSLETGEAKHNSAVVVIQYVDVDDMDPKVLSVERIDEDTPLIVEDTVVFSVKLSEEPKEGKFTKDHIEVAEATLVSVDFVGMAKDLDPDAGNPTLNTPAMSTSASRMIYEYAVAVMPKFEKKDDIKVTVKRFEDQFGNLSMDPAKEMKFKVAPSKVAAKPTGAGNTVKIPDDLIIPAGGYLIVAQLDGDGSSDEEKVSDSYIMYPGDPKATDANTALRRPQLQTYNVIGVNLPNLSPTLRNGATIDLIGDKGLFITEIMWAMDSDKDTRQWIEIKNTTAASIKTKDEKLMFYNVNEPLPAMTTVQDRVGTVTAFGTWYPKGQDGRTVVAANLPAVSLISMQRGMMADGMYADGTMETSWAASAGAPLNFKTEGKGLLIGTPGAMPATFMTPPTPPTEPTPPPTISAAMADDIKITEVMVDTDNGRLPQWIELTSMATGEVSLDGWEMTIDNAIDEKVLGKGNAITVDLDGVVLDVSAHTGNTGKGQSVLVVAWSTGRHSENIRAARVIDLAAQLKQKRQYQLLSYDGFRITLVPPRTGATIASFGDIAGNLHEDWEIPMTEGSGRSSLIRHEIDDGVATHGTDVNGWLLASDTDLIIGQHSYYGSDEDAGTPGHDSGGPLPVELSHFRPARDKATGAAVITWATQSELNNAGFFIKRSQQRNGQFQVINATMVPGAGTTSEKQFYTYTDTTAQPNVVYYYQIEDVSLDGQRQTLTNGIRLKGHIGAAGKLTSTWGELKSSNE